MNPVMNHGCQMKVRGLLCSAGVLAMAGTMLAVAQKQQKWGWVLTEFKVSICCYDQALTVSVTVATCMVSFQQSCMLPCNTGFF